MASVKVELLNGDETVVFFERLSTEFTDKRGPLFRSLGEAYVADTRKRIRTQDSGKWKPVSKWVRAKTGHTVPLQGAGKFVTFRVVQNRVLLEGNTGMGWTLTDHHEGFRNPRSEPDETFDDHGRVVLRIVDPAPLGLKEGTRKFAFKPKRMSKTPRRKIWPSQEEAYAIGLPIASRWFNKVVKETGGRLIK